MRRKRLMATALVSIVIGALLALLAPPALAASTSESGSAPGNRGWVVGSEPDGGDD
jgi:uncharacterized protein involved in exopolysaccharide biosynthesis